MAQGDAMPTDEPDQPTAAARVAAWISRDAVFSPAADPRAFEGLCRRLLNDPRDYPFVSLCLELVCVLLPFAGLLFWPGVFRWWLAPLYWALLFGVFVDRCILMLHNTSHRPLFRKKFHFLNRVIPWFLGPFFGETPETYFAHHIAMHHIEDNLEGDLSSTMRYQRDSFLDFLRYFFRFFFLIHAELAAYFFRKRRPARARRMLLGELAFAAFASALAWVLDWRPVFVVFVVPIVAVRFLMMAGNWGQHAFVDPRQPENNYLSATTCIASRYNRRCWNDGYHIGHHLKPLMHWTELPAELVRNLPRYAAARALVFHGTDNFGVWLSLMTKRHRALAKRYVHLEDTPPPREDEIVALLKSRLVPIRRGALVRPAGLWVPEVS